MRFNLKTKLLLQFMMIGIIPMLVMGVLAYKIASDSLQTAALAKLESVQQVKKAAVERYFNGIQNQLITFTNNKMIVDATQAFRQEFFDVTSSNELTSERIAEMKNELKSFYLGSYSVEYQKQNGEAPPILAKLDQLDDVGIALQYYYIQNNSHPLGSKHLLDFSESDSSSYSQTHGKIHPVVRQYLEKFGYYDIFIADIKTGHIIYSVFKELDYATSLIDGPYADTNFGRAFKAAAKASNADFITLVDYEQYSPSYEAPASFIASPIFDNGEKIGVALFQMPIDRLNAIMGERSGMGESGETILVGPDKLMRSDSHLDKDNRNVVSSFKNQENGLVNLEEVDLAISGKVGKGLSKNYLGQKVITSYAPVDVLGLKWAFLAQMHAEEALSPAVQLGAYMGVIALVSLVFTVGLGLLIGRSLAIPILSIASRLDDNSKLVGGAAMNLSSSGQQLSSLATEQASSIEETAASIEEISAMVKNNVEQAEKSQSLSHKVKDVADQGNKSMVDLIESMKEITESNEKIQELVKVIGEIGEKTEVIDEIVFQTKLLSFNASVEAERAGEHGRGFAVVAQEVGNLAQMSGKAALEIASMVKDSIKNAEFITNENKKKVEIGNKLVQDTARFLNDIAADAENLHDQSQKIVNASKEQSDGISQVNEAMGQLDQATQQNSATAESTAASSEELEGQALALKENVGRLLHLAHGRASGSHGSETKTNPNQPAEVIPLGHQNPKVSPQTGQEPHTIKRAAGDGLAQNPAQASTDEESWDKI